LSGLESAPGEDGVGAGGVIERPWWALDAWRPDTSIRNYESKHAFL
jgi:hypothetical protein